MSRLRSDACASSAVQEERDVRRGQPVALDGDAPEVPVRVEHVQQRPDGAQPQPREAQGGALVAAALRLRRQRQRHPGVRGKAEALALRRVDLRRGALEDAVELRALRRRPELGEEALEVREQGRVQGGRGGGGGAPPPPGPGPGPPAAPPPAAPAPTGRPPRTPQCRGPRRTG